MIYVVFALLIYIVAVMPTKRDLRRLLDAETGARRSGLKPRLEKLKGHPCTLILEELHTVVTSTEVACTVVDVDDEWVLIDAAAAKGKRVRAALKLDDIKGVNE